MIVGYLALALAAAPVEKITIAVPGFTLGDVPAAKGEALTDYFSGELAKHGPFKVMTRSQMSQILGFEKQKQLMGCSDASVSCMAELAGAYGAEVLLVGSIGKIGTRFTVSLKLLDASNGQAIVSASEKFPSEDALIDWLAAQAQTMAPEVIKVRRPGATWREAPVVFEDRSGGARKYAWVPFVAAGAFAVTSGVLFAVAETAPARFSKPATQAEVDAAQLQQTLGWVFGGPRSQPGATGLVMYVVGAPEGAPAVSVVPVREGAVLSFSGAF